MAEKIKRIKASTIPIATSIEGFNALGIRKNADDTIDNVQVSMDLLTSELGDKVIQITNREYSPIEYPEI